MGTTGSSKELQKVQLSRQMLQAVGKAKSNRYAASIKDSLIRTVYTQKLGAKAKGRNLAKK